ncbi:hypothetical protein SAMN04488012_102192 [Palleronia salina]|uniref:Uncharacterized protein n=1 Tax=Palleronia salina TaxID=313368 RepID=A0A1M6CXU6_9RHOB|nr:hypothetical protein SAMN04488012_102192 [Palleronia salina]
MLAASGGLVAAQRVFEAQGFTYRETREDPNSYTNIPDGALRTYGTWPTQENGPKFPTRGLIDRAMLSGSYLMEIFAYFSPDGKEVLAVNLSTVWK